MADDGGWLVELVTSPLTWITELLTNSHQLPTILPCLPVVPNRDHLGHAFHSTSLPILHLTISFLTASAITKEISPPDTFPFPPPFNIWKGTFPFLIPWFTLRSAPTVPLHPALFSCNCTRYITLFLPITLGSKQSQSCTATKQALWSNSSLLTVMSIYTNPLCQQKACIFPLFSISSTCPNVFLNIAFISAFTISSDWSFHITATLSTKSAPLLSSTKCLLSHHRPMSFNFKLSYHGKRVPLTIL